MADQNATADVGETCEPNCTSQLDLLGCSRYYVEMIDTFAESSMESRSCTFLIVPYRTMPLIRSGRLHHIPRHRPREFVVQQ